MKTKGVCLAVVGAAALLAPGMLLAQGDPAGNAGAPPGTSPYSQSPQGMNQQMPQPGTSTGSPSSQAMQSTSMRDSLGAPGQTGQQMLDKQFVRMAMQTGLADEKFAELAEQKGGPEVKDLAQKLADDHNTLNKDMETSADSMGVMLPKKMTKEDQAEYEKLSGLSGKDFDQEYLTYIIKSHWRTVHQFYQESSSAQDQELQAVVVKSMQMMHQHMGMITKAAEAEGITLPPRPPRPAATTASK
jgi:putative membrane protein